MGRAPKKNPTPKEAKLLKEARRMKRLDEKRDLKTLDKKIVLEVAEAATASLSVHKPKLDNAGNVLGKGKTGVYKASHDKRPVGTIFKKSTAQKKTFEKRMEEREERKRVQEKQRALEEHHREQLRKERKRIEQRRKQREKNDLKGAVVQKISNSMKLKKLTPKQMRQLVKM